ncbi:MAG: hypothetical protein ACREL1_07920, partial [bacterium]
MFQIPKRIPLAVSALITLLVAIWGGLLRLQWQLPIPQASWMTFHGPLMISGFFGTIIGLARANVLKSTVGLLVPLTTVLGAWILILGGPATWAAILFLAASLGYLVLSLGFFKKQPAYAAALALIGGCGWAWSNYFWWQGHPIPHVIAGWQLLFVLTISSERLEDASWTAARMKGVMLAIIVGALVTGAIVQPFHPAVGVRVFSAGYLLLGISLFAWDRHWRNPGPTDWGKYTQYCLIAGYTWLLAGGVIGATQAPVDSGFAYDAFLHSIFLGLIFSMVFSHAPRLLPRVLKAPVPFHWFFYSHWALLQISLCARVAGDLFQSTPWRRWGALLN